MKLAFIMLVVAVVAIWLRWAAAPLFEVPPLCPDGFQDIAINCKMWVEAKRQADWARLSLSVGIVGTIAVAASLYFSAAAASGAIDAVRIAQKQYNLGASHTVDIDIKVSESLFSWLRKSAVGLSAKIVNKSPVAIRDVRIFTRLATQEEDEAPLVALSNYTNQTLVEASATFGVGTIVGANESDFIIAYIDAPNIQDDALVQASFFAVLTYRISVDDQSHAVGRFFYLGRGVPKMNGLRDWFVSSTNGRTVSSEARVH